MAIFGVSKDATEFAKVAVHQRRVRQRRYGTSTT